MSKSKIQIGEYAIGGLITTEIFTRNSVDRVQITACDMETKQPIKSMICDLAHLEQAQIWLEDEITSFFYSEMIINQIKKQITDYGSI